MRRPAAPSSSPKRATSLLRRGAPVWLAVLILGSFLGGQWSIQNQVTSTSSKEKEGSLLQSSSSAQQLVSHVAAKVQQQVWSNYQAFVSQNKDAETNDSNDDEEHDKDDREENQNEETPSNNNNNVIDNSYLIGGVGQRRKRRRPTTDDETANKNATTEETTISQPPPPPFTILILTMNRLTSLQRLVKSLQQAHYLPYHQQKGRQQADDKPHINLVFCIDQPPPLPSSGQPRPTQIKLQRAWQGHKETLAWAQKLQGQQAQFDNPWPWGNITLRLAPKSYGLRTAWLEAWRPELVEKENFNEQQSEQQQDPRAIILEDDITVSPLWYTWVQTMHDRYGHLPDVAGVSLQRQQLVPIPTSPNKVVEHVVPTQNNSTVHNNLPTTSQPFLYQLIGSIGFSPTARTWRDFTEFANCSLCTGHAPATPGLITWKWYQTTNPKHMWTQHVIYYMQQRQLYTLYQFPNDARKKLALAAHWREKGEHFETSLGADFELVTDPKALNLPSLTDKAPPLLLPPPEQLTRYDFGMHRVAALHPQLQQLKTVLITCAVSKTYPFANYQTFVTSLRRHYNGAVLMMISNQANATIRDYLHQHNVQTHETDEGRSWEEFNRFRFAFYKDSCREGTYDWCLTIDFRDAIFQGNPFEWAPLLDGQEQSASTGAASSNPKMDAYFFAHNRLWRRDNPEGLWHFDIMRQCRFASPVVRRNWTASVTDKLLVNAGGFFGRPGAFAAIQALLERPEMRRCNDQIVLNVGLYHLGGFGLRFKILPQGYGPINNVAYGGEYNLGSMSNGFGAIYRGKDCLVSNVAHQYNAPAVKMIPPLNAKCKE